MALVASSRLILVLGATGFLGSFVVRRMIIDGYNVRILTRGSENWQDSRVQEFRGKGIDVMIGDIFNDDSLKRSLDGASGVVNLVGSFRESEEISYEKIHVEFLERLLALGAEAGTQRFIQMSCLGATEESECRYFRTRKQAELLVEASKTLWTIFRPSFLFAERFPLLELLRPLIKFKLFLPMIGSGTNKVQPVFAGDVANCVSQSIFERIHVGQSYELVGPDEYTMIELLEMVRGEMGIGGPTMNIPSEFSSKTFNLVAKALPKSFFSKDFVGIFNQDSYGSQDVMLRHFEVRNNALDEYFPKIMESL